MARCHVRTYESEVKSMNCDVQPKDVNEEYSRWSFARHAEFMLARRAETSGRSLGSDSAWITAIAFTGNALQSDTLRVTVASIPSYRKQTLSDTVAPCGKTVAFTQDTGTVYVAQGPANGSALTITKALRQTPHSVRDNGSCTASLQNRSASVAFLLGGIGATATKPVTLRYTGADKGSVLDPRKHMLALQPHLKFRIADLKLGSRAGGQLTLRIRVDAARPTDVVPMVVSYTNKAIWQNEAQFPVLVALRTWDFRITDYVGTDTWIYLYLVRRN